MIGHFFFPILKYEATSVKDFLLILRTPRGNIHKLNMLSYLLKDFLFIGLDGRSFLSWLQFKIATVRHVERYIPQSTVSELKELQ